MSTTAVATAINPSPNSVLVLDPKLKDATKNVYRVRLLRGRHIDRQGPADESGRRTLRTFQANVRTGTFPEFETVNDLAGDKAHSPTGFPRKFENVHTVQREPPIDPTKRQPGETVTAYLGRLNDIAAAARTQTEQTVKALDTMGMPQLQEFAETEEIDISTAKNVEEVRKIIRSAFKK